MTDLHRVATIYMRAAERGEPPTQAVHDALGVPRSTAGRWVAEARAEGLIPPVRPGSSPRRHLKLVRVAAALGVDPDDLRDAVRDHANGDLRLHRAD